jgi:transcriptional regulator with XRE-family HTH domain
MAKLPRNATAQKQKARTRFSDEYGVLMELLIELRLKAKVTQQQIAEAVGKSQQHVSAWENREREINVIDVWKWCNAVGIKTSKFYELFEKRVQKL